MKKLMFMALILLSVGMGIARAHGPSIPPDPWDGWADCEDGDY